MGQLLASGSINLANCDHNSGLWVIHVGVLNTVAAISLGITASLLVKFKFSVPVLRLVPRLYPCPEILDGRGQKSLFE